TDLLRGNPKDFVWNKTADVHFRFLKECFSPKYILRHFNPYLETSVEADSSDFAIGGILSQKHGKTWYPVAFISRKLTPAELNYEIYDKEMLAIVECFKKWRHYLESVQHTTKVYTDHKNLEWFATTKQLNR